MVRVGKWGTYRANFRDLDPRNVLDRKDLGSLPLLFDAERSSTRTHPEATVLLGARCGQRFFLKAGQGAHGAAAGAFTDLCGGGNGGVGRTQGG